MQKANTAVSNFHIHAFILHLGLKPSELLLYAALYSFSSNGNGTYFGTMDFFTELLNISPRQLARLMKSLSDKGLIEKVKLGERVGWRTTENGTRSECCAKSALPDAGKASDDYLYINEANEPSDECEDDIDESCEDEDNTPDRGEMLLEIHKRIKPKYKLLPFGSKELIWMTREQYEALAALAPSETIQHYIYRLEMRIEEGDNLPHCPYKIIRKWMLEDLGT